MKFLLFDQLAISNYISTMSLQSIEYEQGKRFIQHICGELSSEIFEKTAVEYYEDGIIFYGSKPNSYDSIPQNDHKIFCIDLTACNILSEKDNRSDLLTVLQKAFRVTQKIWNHQPFSSSERVNGSKSIVFPFVITDRRRIVIERSNTILRLEKRGINYPLLAYKYSAEDAPQGEETVNSSVLRIAGELYVANVNNAQAKIRNTETTSTIETNSVFEQFEARDIVHRKDFIFLSYDEQIKRLTDTQEAVVSFESIDSPLRVDGAAGTGKTMSLILRAYKLLKEKKESNEPFSVIFFAHSESTNQRNQELFSFYAESDYFMKGKHPQKIIFTTLLNYCVEIAANIPKEALVEKDAGEAKTYQLMFVEKVLNNAKHDNLIKTYRPLLSEQMRNFFDDNDMSLNTLCSILQHEFSIQIKGRTDGTFDSYKEIPSIKNGLPCGNENDKELIFRLFNKYQDELKSLGYYDVDDAVMEALSRLNAPIWRRERTEKGFDYIFVDEMHLFNINEQSVFHYLTKNLSRKNIPICFALDYSQAIGDRGDITKDYIEHAFGEKLEKKNYSTVFRNSPQIAQFCSSIAAAGTLMFQESFVNPYSHTQSVFTDEEERRCKIPVLHMYDNDEEMLLSLKNHIESITRELQCRHSEIAVIAFDEKFLLKETIDMLYKETGIKFAILKPGNKIQNSEISMISPYDVNGLEFKAVILLGVDEGRIPQTAGVCDISHHYIKYSSFNLLYLSSSRAKYRVVVLGSKLNGISSCLEHSISSGWLNIEM